MQWGIRSLGERIHTVVLGGGRLQQTLQACRGDISALRLAWRACHVLGGGTLQSQRGEALRSCQTECFSVDTWARQACSIDLHMRSLPHSGGQHNCQHPRAVYPKPLASAPLNRNQPDVSGSWRRQSRFSTTSPRNLDLFAIAAFWMDTFQPNPAFQARGAAPGSISVGKKAAIEDEISPGHSSRPQTIPLLHAE